MFFLKDLPTQQMVETYATPFGANPDSVHDALVMLRRASLLIRRIEAYFAQHDLSQLRFLVLIVVDREQEDQSLTPNEIAQRIDVSKPVITRTLQTLQKDGLITVSNSPTDGRSKRVKLTELGQKRLHGSLPGYYQILSEDMAETNRS